jgi:regulator of protease activity HflC (stomatin/prohibitin superfamily)
MGAEGKDWQVMGQRMLDSIAGLSSLVQSVKEEQAGQAQILGLLGDTAKANTTAIETIQLSQAAVMTKQQEFIADLQRVREMAESANQKSAQLLASPGKDPKKGGRQ